MTSLKVVKIVNGTTYHKETSEEVASILEACRLNKTRIIIHLGDAETGADWCEQHDICGYVGRSTGESKIPLLIYNRRAMGGIGILDHCIVKIVASKGKRVLYVHHTYHT